MQHRMWKWDCVSLKNTQSAMICYGAPATASTLSHSLSHSSLYTAACMRWNECSVLAKSMLSICNANNVANIYWCLCCRISLLLCVSILFLCHQCIMDLSICTSLMNPFSIFRCAASSFSMFLYSSLHSVKYSVCIFSLDSQPGCAAIQS